MIADGLGMAGSQWCFFTLEGSGLPLAAVAGWGVTVCVGPLCLTDRVPWKVTFFAVFLVPLGGFGLLLRLFCGWLPS